MYIPVGGCVKFQIFITETDKKVKYMFILILLCGTWLHPTVNNFYNFTANRRK